MENANKDLQDYLKGIYIPNACYGDLVTLGTLINEDNEEETPQVPLRYIRKSDAESSRNKCLQIFTKGDGSRKCFAGYRFALIDFNHIGEKYAEGYIYEEDKPTSGKPLRIAYHLPTILIIGK